MAGNILQINDYSFDERYYQYTTEDADGNKIVKFFPSVTFLIGCTWNKGDAFTKWIGQVGTVNATIIMEEAGAIGSYVHDAVETLADGDEVDAEGINDVFKPWQSLKAKRSLKAFVDFCEDYEPRIDETEYITYDEELGYAGTVDLRCFIRADKFMTKTAINAHEKAEIKKISEELDLDPRLCWLEMEYKWIETWIDLKTSKDIHDEHRMQLASYLHSETGGDLSKGRAAILHLGNSTKAGYSFLPLKDIGEDGKTVADWFTDFKVCCLTVFKHRFPNAKPKTDTFPKKFSLTKEQK